MRSVDKKKAFYITCITIPSLVMGGVFVATSSNNGTFARASNDKTMVLDSSNSPVLSSGSGTVTTEKGVIFEYHNALDYASGHVSLTHQGYFGVSSASPYGVTGISNISITFEAGSTGELWLLNSDDGVIWGEVEMVKTPEETSKTSATSELANDWRYIRFYYHDSNSGSININSLTVSYSCSGTDAKEDVDSAKVSNIIQATTSSNIEYNAVYDDLSPNSIGGQAISFNKTDTKSSTIGLGFGKIYTIGQIQTSKVEFDMKTSKINYGKSIELTKDATRVGSTIYSNSSSSYKCTNIEGDWYHIEIGVTAFITPLSGYNGNDKPHTDVLNKEINGIKINAGACVIDNLRITSTPGELGNYNNTTQYPPKANTVSWLKTSWIGKLYPDQVVITFLEKDKEYPDGVVNDDTLAERIPLDDPLLMNGSPFYIRWLKATDVIVSVTIVSGYNRESHQIQKTFTVGS